MNTSVIDFLEAHYVSDAWAAEPKSLPTSWTLGPNIPMSISGDTRQVQENGEALMSHHPIVHFIFDYTPLPTDDWLCCVVYFDSVNIEASSWLCIYDLEAL
jgi:hypothetical protein